MAEVTTEINNPMGWWDILLNTKGNRYTIDPNGKMWLHDTSGMGAREIADTSRLPPGAIKLKWTGTLDSTFKNGIELHTHDDAANRIGSPIYVGPLKGRTPTSKTLRWPQDSINTGTDYVFFQFGKYPAPFAKDVDNITNTVENNKVTTTTKLANTSRETYEMYSQMDRLDPDHKESVPFDIMLPMPQDLSNEVQAQWQGKQFTATGRAATAALAAGNWSYASNVVKNISGSSTALVNALQTSVLNAIPGVGGSLSFNDVSGSTKGIVINPNAELLYDSPEMRELGMIFKMVPRNASEAATIRRICSAFRKASLPSWGAVGDVSMFKNDDFSPKKKEAPTVDISRESNWIRVPNLCKFTFMHGSVPHPYIYQFKPCAIQAVEVNYTPDGTFATYEDGAPVAVELRLNFMETKLIFANEVNIDPGVSV